MENIIWKPMVLEGFENFEVSNEGKIRNKTTKKEMGYKHVSGYMRVNINGRPYPIHRLIAVTFNPIPLEEFHSIHIHHKDRNKTNNRIDNLEYMTPREHILHEMKEGINRMGLTGKDSFTFKGVIGKFDSRGYLLDLYYGRKEMDLAGYDHRYIYSVINKKYKTYAGFFWKRFPKDQEPKVGTIYDLNDPIFDSVVRRKIRRFKKNRNSLQMLFCFMK